MSGFVKSYLCGFWPTETFLRPWGVIVQKKVFQCLDFSASLYVSLFKDFLVCYNGYQGLSWIRISSKFLFYIKSYVDSTIQILKIIFLRVHGEKTLMIKWWFRKAFAAGSSLQPPHISSNSLHFLLPGPSHFGFGGRGGLSGSFSSFCFLTTLSQIKLISVLIA